MRFINNTIILLFFSLLYSCISGKDHKLNQNESIISLPKTKLSSDIQSPTVLGFPCKEFQLDISKKYYLNSKSTPYLTKTDSVKLIQYAIATGQIEHAISKTDTLLWKLLYLLPRVRSIVDTVLYDSLMFNKNIKFGKLERSNMYDLEIADAVIIGKVEDKKYVRDSSKCFYYKTEYLVSVQEVLHSYFELRNSDTVILKSKSGYLAGCNQADPKLFETIGHSGEYQIGDQWIFFLNHSEYYNKFIYGINDPYTKEKKFDDEYCKNAFQLYNGNHLYNYSDSTIINNIRSFYKLFLKF